MRGPEGSSYMYAWHFLPTRLACGRKKIRGYSGTNASEGLRLRSSLAIFLKSFYLRSSTRHLPLPRIGSPFLASPQRRRSCFRTLWRASETPRDPMVIRQRMLLPQAFRGPPPMNTSNCLIISRQLRALEEGPLLPFKIERIPAPLCWTSLIWGLGPSILPL